MKSVFVSVLFMFNSFVNASSLNQRLACQKSLMSSIEGLYNPKEGYFFCDEPTTECFLVYENGDTYKVELPQSPTYVMTENFVEMADKRQNIYHHLLTWVEPRSNQKAYADIFWGVPTWLG